MNAPVDLDELGHLLARCRLLALGLGALLGCRAVPDADERDALGAELAAVIEETAERAARLAQAL